MILMDEMRVGRNCSRFRAILIKLQQTYLKQHFSRMNRERERVINSTSSKSQERLLEEKLFQDDLSPRLTHSR